MPTATVHSLRYAPGQAVRVYNAHEVEMERRTGRGPIKTSAVTDGVFDSDHDCEITAAAGKYAMIAVTNEIQSVTVDATGGTFTLTYAGQTTSALDFDSTAEEVQAALVALSNIGANDVAVTGGPGDEGGTTPYLVQFRNDLGARNVAAMTSDPGSLTGGAGTADIATETGGAVATGAPWLLFTIDA